MTTPLIVAVFGGSFDPPHNAHKLFGLHIAQTPGIDRVIAPVCYQQEGKNLLAFEHRFAMTKLAFADEPRIEVSDLERELGGESLTIRTLRELKRRNPTWELRFAAGGDVVKNRHRWGADWEEILVFAPPIFLPRVGVEGSGEAFLPDVSSTFVRGRLAAGDHAAVAAALPPAVADYVFANGLYRAA
jgi:nicotinate-nucleotide adenylyltransferase